MFVPVARGATITSRRRAASRLCLVAGLLLALAGIPAASAKEGMDRDTRIVLIRGLMREIGVATIPLPSGKRGVHVDSKGKLDQARAQEELRNNGLAIKPGMPVEITKMTFKSSEIIFELNGGGKRGKKWYQRIEVGMGTTTSPIAPQPQSAAFGSSVTLAFPGKLPDLTVAQVKEALAGVIDFNRHAPTVLYSPNIPPEFKEAIKNHQVIVGMTRDAVLSSRGAPDRKVREVHEGVEKEDWIYGLPPHVLYVTFDGDLVVSVHQY